MRFRPLSLTCECGLSPLHFMQIGLTPQHQLAIVWWCDACQRNICVLKDLSDCWRDCPQTGDLEDIAEGELRITKEILELKSRVERLEEQRGLIRQP